MNPEALLLQQILCAGGSEAFGAVGWVDLRYEGYVFWYLGQQLVGGRMERSPFGGTRWSVRFRLAGFSYFRDYKIRWEPTQQDLALVAVQFKSSLEQFLERRSERRA